MVNYKAKKLPIYIVLSIGALLMIIPFLWMMSTSLKTMSETIAMPPKWIPSVIQFGNYIEALSMAPFGRYFINSLIVTLLTTIAELLTTILAAYAFSKLHFYGKGICFSLLIATMMVPGEMLLIPNFVTISNLGWMDSYKGLIIPWTANIVSIFLLRQFFLDIPKELSYAAKIDNCSEFKFIWYIMVPIAKPALITIAILKMINSWNSFLWPLIVTNSVDLRTLPIGLTSFTTEVGTRYELLMAATTFVIAPMIVLFFIMQKYILAGVGRAGIKG